MSLEWHRRSDIDSKHTWAWQMDEVAPWVACSGETGPFIVRVNQTTGEVTIKKIKVREMLRAVGDGDPGV